eukprot:g13312.t1
MSVIEHKLGEERVQENYLDYTNLRMAWYPSGSKETDSNTCTTDLASRVHHSTSVVIHLFDEVTDTIATGFQVAYSCRSNTSDTHMFTDIALALTETRKLDGTTERSYRAETIYSYPYVSNQVGENIPNITRPYAFLDLRIKQGPNSLETITEDAPASIGELLGDIGGFWDILLLLWPVFFVVVSQEEPTLKPQSLLL